MENNASNNINYYLKISKANENDLASIRAWKNLKVAFEGSDIWVTNFSNSQINSTEVKSIPYKECYYTKNGKLYNLNSILPNGNEPKPLWTPIQRALPISFKSENFNYFGTEEKVKVQIIKSETEKKADAIICDIDQLGKYIPTASNFRLEKIQWVSINHKQAFLIGTPILPLSGKAYWKTGNSFIPVGFKFELSILSKEFELKIDPYGNNYIIWNSDGTYFLIQKAKCDILSIGGYRMTVNSSAKSEENNV